MSQVTIYLDEDVEKKMQRAAESARLSRSKWITKLIEEKVANEWSQSVVDLAGCWQDFPTIDELRTGLGADSQREKF